MPYYKIYILKNSGSGVGHAFIELTAGSETWYFELNSNTGFVGPKSWMLGQNPISAPGYYDGQINSTKDIGIFISDAERIVSSDQIDISYQSYIAMLSYAKAKAEFNDGQVDYVLNGN